MEGGGNQPFDVATKVSGQWADPSDRKSKGDYTEVVVLLYPETKAKFPITNFAFRIFPPGRFWMHVVANSVPRYGLPEQINISSSPYTVSKRPVRQSPRSIAIVPGVPLSAKASIILFLHRSIRYPGPLGGVGTSTLGTPD